MKKTVLSLFFILASLFAAWLLVQLRPAPQAKAMDKKIPFVETIVAKKVSRQSTILSYGLVKPRTLTTLIAEVPGIVKGVAPFSDEENSSASFRAGGFFRKNELLLSIEDTDLKTILAEAQANLSRTELQLFQERELQKQAKLEWGDRDWSLASDLVKRIPHLLKAEAEMKAAQARLSQAEIDLSRASVKGPFQGRIMSTMVDLGQQVGSGASAALAEIYALDFAEIDLSLSLSQLSFLGFVDGFSPLSDEIVELEVLDSEEKVIHVGTLERSEGVMDPRTRLTKLVALVANCFANPFSDKPIKNPLTVSQFVKLRLLGKEREVFVIPDSAFRTQNTILVVDGKSRLHLRTVLPIHRYDKEVWVSEGIRDGEKVCITPMEIMAEGMEVKEVGESEADQNQTGS